MFKLTFNCALGKLGEHIPVTIFCNSFNAYESLGATGGHLFTVQDNGRKAHYITMSNVLVDTI